MINYDDPMNEYALYYNNSEGRPVIGCFTESKHYAQLFANAGHKIVRRTTGQVLRPEYRTQATQVLALG